MPLPYFAYRSPPLLRLLTLVVVSSSAATRDPTRASTWTRALRPSFRNPLCNPVGPLEHGMNRVAGPLCKDTAPPYSATGFVNALTALEILKRAYAKNDSKKLTETLAREAPRILKEWKSMLASQYVAPPPPPAAHALPPPPTRPAPPTPSAAPPRPTSGPTGSK
jgi:hypothetical protein